MLRPPGAGSTNRAFYSETGPSVGILLLSRQMNGEGGFVAVRANVNGAIVGIYDLTNHKQPQSKVCHIVATGLGQTAIERIEYPFSDRGLDRRSGVRDLQPDSIVVAEKGDTDSRIGRAVIQCILDEVPKHLL